VSKLTGQVSWLLAASVNPAAFPSYQDSGNTPLRAANWLTSYSSAPASDSHRLPYSAWANTPRPPGENI